MKVGVIGVGHVGGEAALQMALRDSCRELVLIDADSQLADSQALDIAQTSALACGPRVRAGDYQDLAGAEVVVLSDPSKLMSHASEPKLFGEHPCLAEALKGRKALEVVDKAGH